MSDNQALVGTFVYYETVNHNLYCGTVVDAYDDGSILIKEERNSTGRTIGNVYALVRPDNINREWERDQERS